MSELTEEIEKEVKVLLKNACFNYPAQNYVTPRLVAPEAFKKPELYPILSKRKKQMVTRFVSDYLKKIGRVKRGANGHCCWVHPEHAKSGVVG